MCSGDQTEQAGHDRRSTSVADSREIIDPAWPPAAGAYDYVATLNNVELAWEFLRRNPAYRTAYIEAEISPIEPRRLPTGQRVWNQNQLTPTAPLWNLCSFRRSIALGVGRARGLGHRDWHRHCVCYSDQRRRRLKCRPQSIFAALYPSYRR